MPNGISASFNPPSINGGSGTSTLTLSAPNTAPGGIYDLTNSVTVYGIAGIGVRTAPIALVVKPRPFALNAMVQGSNLIMTVTNGFPGATCCLLETTNLSLSTSQWTTVTTNVFGTNGSFDSTNAINASVSGRFFILEY